MAALGLGLPLAGMERVEPTNPSPKVHGDLAASRWEGTLSNEPDGKSCKIVLEIASERDGRIEGKETFPTLETSVRVEGAISEDRTEVEFTAVEAIRGNRVPLPCKHTAQLTPTQISGTWASGARRGNFSLARVESAGPVVPEPVGPETVAPKPPRRVRPRQARPVTPPPSDPVTPNSVEPSPVTPQPGPVRPKPKTPEPASPKPYQPRQEGKVFEVDDSDVTVTYVVIDLGERDRVKRGSAIQIELSKEPMRGGRYFTQEATVTEVFAEKARARLNNPRVGQAVRGDNVRVEHASQPDAPGRFRPRSPPRRSAY